MERHTDPQRIETATGERLVVVLTGNGLGGYEWRLRGLPAGLALRAERDLAPADLAPGAAGRREFELEALEPGTYLVRFELRRAWEDGVEREHVVSLEAR